MYQPFIESFAEGAAEPLVGLLQATRRVYWAFLVAAAALATVVWWLKLRGRCSLGAFLFPKRIWLHPSARLDYQLMCWRSILSATLLAPFVVSSVRLAAETTRVLASVFGVGPWGAASPAFVAATFTLTGFLAEDAVRYLVHRWSHFNAILWHLHRVHHSAAVLTPFTVYRTHPVESILMRGGAAIGVGMAAGVVSWLCHGRVSAWEILGVHALGFTWNLAGSNLRHSHVWLSYGRLLEHLLISPAQHQIHHSEDPRHHHRNFGSVLAIWDLLGGTLYVPRGRERIRFGLPPASRNHENSVISMLWAPLKGAVKQAAAGSRNDGR